MGHIANVYELTEPQRERFRLVYSQRTAANGDCIEWQGKQARYPQLWVLGVKMHAHRAAYMTFVGPIPHGNVIDHLCMNPLCVNPAHLEPVTQRVNVQRAVEAGRSNGFGNWSETDACKRGHPWTPESTYITSRGKRSCRICERARQRAARAANPEKYAEYKRRYEAKKVATD